MPYIEEHQYGLADCELGNTILMMEFALPQALGRLKTYASGLTVRLQVLQRYLFDENENLIKSSMELVEERLPLVGISADALAKNEGWASDNPDQ